MNTEKKVGFITITKKDIIVVLSIIGIACIAFIVYLLIRFFNYRKAVKLFEDGEYLKAYEAFDALKEYKDSSEKIAEIKELLLQNATVGSNVYFGYYYIGDEKDNEKKGDILWKVLEIKDGKALLITTQNVYYSMWGQYDSYDKMPFWEDSMLRNYLNGNFYLNAFSDEERAKIVETVVKPDEDTRSDMFADALGKYDRPKENETVDKVFVLSISEAMKYFPTDESRKSSPTYYTVRCNKYMEPGLFHTTDLIHDECYSWWLRNKIDTKYEEHFNCYVTATGNIMRANSGNHAVRPVIWITLDD
ncbi:MAG: hypothetical protein IK055_04700 [Lachnospiraceae bacterium]|nr:hypothetical protein [Lachnospiraceae bacterium]